MHILLVPSWYKTDKEPFMGTFFEEQARALKKLGHVVGIIYPEYSPLRNIFNEKETINDFYLDNGLPTYSIHIQSKIPKFRRLSYRQFGKSVNKIFEEYIKKYGIPDVIHAHSLFFGGVAANYIAQEHKIPFVITEHLTSFIMGTISNKDDRNISKEIFINADRSLIVSNNFKSDLEKELSLPENTFEVVHNMVADFFFENNVPKFFLPDDEFIFFTNSFLLPRKNHKLLFEAIKMVKEKKHKVKLRVGGDGPLMDELKSLAKESGIEENVQLLGGLTRMQVKQELDKCHAFVLASFYETFGVVLIESLACGRPVIATDSGGPRDFINETNGLIVPEFNPHKFAAAMETVMKNYSKYNQKAISENCFRDFNEKRIAMKLQNIYTDVLEKRKVANPIH
jgi:glycosyltransferase involved in cell wall biosynthesis